jgi:hypothetical protein
MSSIHFHSTPIVLGFPCGVDGHRHNFFLKGKIQGGRGALAYWFKQSGDTAGIYVGTMTLNPGYAGIKARSFSRHNICTYFGLMEQYRF